MRRPLAAFYHAYIHALAASGDLRCAPLLPSWQAAMLPWHCDNHNYGAAYCRISISGVASAHLHAT